MDPTRVACRLANEAAWQRAPARWSLRVPAKRRFWAAFRALGDWYAALPPYRARLDSSQAERSEVDARFVLRPDRAAEAGREQRSDRWIAVRDDRCVTLFEAPREVVGGGVSRSAIEVSERLHLSIATVEV